MKIPVRSALVLLIAVAAPLLFSRCSGASDPVAPASSPDMSNDFAFNLTTIPDFPLEPLTGGETEGLRFMREEEKLARDVYTRLYAQWNQPVFSNIASSEQTHTDAIRILLERYSLEDPVTGDLAGEFADSTLAVLYEQLIQTGTASLIDGLKTGAAIEEIDILDLEHQLDEVVDNADIRFVYENLMRGSENHLRAFVRNLQRQGVTYTPRYLDETRYQEILSTAANGRRPW